MMKSSKTRQFFRFGVSRAYANCVIGASTVADNLATCVAKPTNEYQLRPLVLLEPAQQRTVWEEAVRTADGKIVTYKLGKALVTELIGPAPSQPSPKKKEASAPPPIISVHVGFYRGNKAIAKFLGVHVRTAQAFRVEPNIGIHECARLGEAIAFGIPYWVADAFGEES